MPVFLYQVGYEKITVKLIRPCIFSVHNCRDVKQHF